MEGEELLQAINQEKFKRKLSLFRAISTRVIAVGLILAIIGVGYIQVSYAREVSQIKEQYGPLAYCYLCGKENLRACECQYIPQLQQSSLNLSFIAEQTAERNVLPCPDKNSWAYKNNISINLSIHQAD